jgi:AraC-like DNA-binding protein
MTKTTKKEVAVFTLANELGGIELLDASYQKQNFSRHSHEGYTVGIIERGAQQFFRSGANHIAPQNSIILVNADQVHNGSSASEHGWSYKAMYPLPEQFAAINHELGLSTQDSPYFPEAVVNDSTMANMLRMTFNVLSTSKNTLLRESIVYSTMIKLMARHSKHGTKLVLNTKAQSQMLVIKTYLDENASTDISLEALSTMVGLSPYYLIKQFQKKYGLPPHAYQIQTRVRLAKQKIKQGLKLLDVALVCGFHDQSHLSRHFKRTMGLTPGQYAKEINHNFIQEN